MSGVRVRAQRGAALVVSLIMLVLITLLVITALNLGSLGFRSVSNTQFRDEAIAAANVAIQQVISSPFFLDPEEADEDINVDLDNDSTTDYVVSIAVPQCIFVSEAEAGKASSLSLPPSMTSGSTWNSVWDIDATVAPDSNAGEASVRIRTGVRVLLNQTQRDDVCP
jgi:hypothetical protein